MLFRSTIELVSVLANKTSIGDYEPFTTIAAIDLGSIGYFIVGSFIAAWVISVIIWRVRKYETRYSSGIHETEHSHTEMHLD